MAGPVLAHVAGNWAWLAMLGLCALAYLFGAVMRFNISHIEPLIASGAPPASITWLERISSFALAFAYFISVAYYLNLLAAFALKAAGIINPELVSWISSFVIIALGAIGSLKGLHALENVEMPAVSLKLALITGLLAGLALTAILEMIEGGVMLSEHNHATGKEEISILLGLVILVQGFETSRYLGDSYPEKTRIQTMRYAQLIATVIYMAFIILITPYFKSDLPVNGGETQVIDMLAPLGSFFAPLIILTALASQLSAAVADMNGAGGLLEDASNHKISVRVGYFSTALIALIITWSANIFDIITFASKAFVLYYGLQSLTAMVALMKVKEDHSCLRFSAKMALFSLATLLAIIVLIFGKPVG
ncbi:MAG: hypothetical protein DHS20C08_16530 [Rhodomicrobium sp.]|nr:MAG: hypothetical protein DHS20C08_16530 [Rhodomicrobium sp.]